MLLVNLTGKLSDYLKITSYQILEITHLLVCITIIMQSNRFFCANEKNSIGLKLQQLLVLFRHKLRIEHFDDSKVFAGKHKDEPVVLISKILI